MTMPIMKARRPGVHQDARETFTSTFSNDKAGNDKASNDKASNDKGGAIRGATTHKS